MYVEENVHVWESTERPLLTCFFTCTSFYSMFNFQLWKVTKHALFNTLPCLQVWHRECKSPPHLGTSLLSKSVPFWESSCMSAAAAAKKKKSHNTAVQKRPSHFCIVLFWKKINNAHLERNMISNTTAERARHPSGIHGDGYVLVAVESGECIAQFTCLFSSWVPYVARRVWNQWGVCEEGAVREFAWTSEPQRGKVFTSNAYQSPSSALCLSLSLRYLIRSDPLAHVPEEPPLHSSSLKERRESSTDTREDTQLW